MNLDPDTNQMPPMDKHQEARLLAEADHNLAAQLQDQNETRLSALARKFGEVFKPSRSTHWT